LAIIAIAMLVAGSAHAGEQCALHQIGSLELQRAADGSLTVPVTVNGQPRTMFISISGPFSWFYADFVDAQNFNQPMAYLPGSAKANPRKDIYEVPEFGFGKALIKNAQFFRMKSAPSRPHGVIGELTVDLLSKFDMEVDLKRGRINLFLQDHCPGKVVYWTHSPYAAIPFENDSSQHPNLPMELDGKQIRVALTLGSGPAVMGMEAAKRIFGLNKDTFRVTQVADTPSDHPKYRYPFEALNVNGLLIKRPEIDIDPKVTDCLTYTEGFKRSWCFGGADVYLGRSELSQLRLFFAFKEQVLYVTPADAH
jgi:hypothetical protein